MTRLQMIESGLGKCPLGRNARRDIKKARLRHAQGEAGWTRNITKRQRTGSVRFKAMPLKLGRKRVGKVVYPRRRAKGDHRCIKRSLVWQWNDIPGASEQRHEPRRGRVERYGPRRDFDVAPRQ